MSQLNDEIKIHDNEKDIITNNNKKTFHITNLKFDEIHEK